jgi:hypothetical protein
MYTKLHKYNFHEFLQTPKETSKIEKTISPKCIEPWDAKFIAPKHARVAHTSENMQVACTKARSNLNSVKFVLIWAAIRIEFIFELAE